MSTLSVEKLVEFLEAYKKQNRKKLEPHNKVFQIKGETHKAEEDTDDVKDSILV